MIVLFLFGDGVFIAEVAHEVGRIRFEVTFLLWMPIFCLRLIFLAEFECLVDICDRFRFSCSAFLLQTRDYLLQRAVILVNRRHLPSNQLRHQIKGTLILLSLRALLLLNIPLKGRIGPFMLNLQYFFDPEVVEGLTARPISIHKRKMILIDQ